VRGRPRWLLMTATLGLCALGGPVVQMACFGKTDYRRPADAIVVFGARVYADGHLSQALADRMNTACRLYHQGLADRLIVSGGPGDGEIYEADAMRRHAIERGVPGRDILVDRRGVNTEATARNTGAMLDSSGAPRVLAVSHFYHLPRIKLAYQRAGVEAFTVPAHEPRLLRALPRYMLREVAAWWAYYLRVA